MVAAVPESAYRFPDARYLPEGEDFITVGADLEPGTLLEAYRSGYFPMPVALRRFRPAEIGWFSPDPRGVLPLDGLKVSRSLRRSLRRYDCTINQAFGDVIRNCGDPDRPMGWIDDNIVAAYEELHRLGFAHSVETWSDGELVGGLYGIAIDGLFAGESMFSHATDASKVALVHLVEVLTADGVPRLLDVQWATDHLKTLGVIELDRPTYVRRLWSVRDQYPPDEFDLSC